MNAAKTNHISLSFDAISENEAFARMTAAMFMAQLNPTLDDVEDVKTAVSEAVTNAIIHGYEMGDDNISSGQADHQAAEEKSCPQVHMNCSYIGRELYIEISDSGVGIQDVAKAMNRYTHPNHSLTDQAWVFHSWKHLWTRSQLHQNRDTEQQ